MSASKKTVMIVDDTRFVRNYVGSMVERAGYAIVATAENGSEAVERYKKHKPDVVTMDVVMPVMDGIEALGNILEIDPNANVVMLTSIGAEDQLNEAKEIGAKGYLLKPVKKGQLLEVLNKLAPITVEA